MLSKYPKFHKIQDAVDAESAPENIDWIVTEKIDGANVAIIISRDGSCRLGSRNGYLGDRFYDIDKTFHEKLGMVFPRMIANLWNWKDDETHVVFHGEFYGKGIMNRIPYGEKTFAFFSLSIVKSNGDTIVQRPFHELEELLGKAFMGDMVVPVLGKYGSLEAALEFPCDRNSLIAGTSQMEGIVVIPDVKDGWRWTVKKKGGKFKETSEPVDGTLQAKFMSYCTENRMMSVFTKMGVDVTIVGRGKHMAGKFITEFLKDAKKDFLADMGKDESEIPPETFDVKVYGIFKKALEKAYSGHRTCDDN